MWNETIKTIKAQLYERVSSPLLSTFLISWVVWNHRFLAVLLSSMSVTDKFSYIDTHLFSHVWHTLIFTFVGPLMTGLAMIYIYPIPAKKVYEHWRKKQNELKEIQQKIDDESPLTKEEARQIRREALEKEIQYDLELDRRSKEITRLREIIADYEKKQTTDKFLSESDLKDLSKNIKQKTNKTQLRNLSLAEEELLVAIGNEGPLDSELYIHGQKDKVGAEYLLDQLLEKGLIEGDNDGDYKLTAKGRRYLVEKKIDF